VEAHPEILAIEVVTAKGSRCVQLQVDKTGNLLAKNGDEPISKISPCKITNWMPMEIDIDAKKQQYHIQLGNKTVAKNYQFTAAGKPERIIFRTGAYRLQDDVTEYKSGNDFVPGWDKKGADEPVPEAVFYLRQFIVKNQSVSGD
jgi:hypothetical protein